MSLRHLALMGDAERPAQALPQVLAVRRDTHRARRNSAICGHPGRLAPLASPVDILGWLAHVDPDGLVVRLNVVTSEDGACKPIGGRPATDDRPIVKSGKYEAGHEVTSRMALVVRLGWGWREEVCHQLFSSSAIQPTTASRLSNTTWWRSGYVSASSVRRLRWRTV